MSILKFDKDIKTVEDALDASGLNFVVEQNEMLNTTTGKTSNLIKQLYRGDNGDELGIVGKGYSPIQNSIAFGLFDVINKEEGTIFDKVSTFHNGRSMVLTCSYPDTTIIAHNDEIRKCINIVNGHDGKTPLRVDFMVERLVCSNGLRANVIDAVNSIKLKHTNRIEDRIQEALKVISKSKDFFNSFEIKAKELTQKILDKKMVDDFLNGLFPSDAPKTLKIKNDIQGLFENGKGNNGTNAWEIYNGLTEYADHFQGKEENRNENNSIGRGIKLKEHAWELACSI